MQEEEEEEDGRYVASMGGLDVRWEMLPQSYTWWKRKRRKC